MNLLLLLLFWREGTRSKTKIDKNKNAKNTKLNPTQIEKHIKPIGIESIRGIQLQWRIKTLEYALSKCFGYITRCSLFTLGSPIWVDSKFISHWHWAKTFEIWTTIPIFVWWGSAQKQIKTLDPKTHCLRVSWGFSICKIYGHVCY